MTLCWSWLRRSPPWGKFRHWMASPQGWSVVGSDARECAELYQSDFTGVAAEGTQGVPSVAVLVCDRGSCQLLVAFHSVEWRGPVVLLHWGDGAAVAPGNACFEYI
mmetsp:Transcript_93342/g.249953  ORF Transcript_93342/g.249953 Transcript_93342/m.249953 type:complete len:106 (-) Transcript_93342:49-366(-)